MANVTDSNTGYSTEKVEAQDTLPALVAIRRGQCITIDAATGKWRLALATTAANAGYMRWFAVKDAAINEALTGNLIGEASYGAAFDALSFGVPIFLSDTPGELSSTAGTVSVQVGVVMPDFRSVTPARILRFK